jgi:hypothetical protein
MAAALRWPVSKLPTAVGAQMIHRSADDPAAVAFVTFFAILKVYEILLPGGHLLHRQSAEELRIECGGGRGRLLV